MSCSKIFSGDSPELTCEILKYLQKDFSTLYSCILVNRLWCRLAIPLLWEDPFSLPFLKYLNTWNIGVYIEKWSAIAFEEDENSDSVSNFKRLVYISLFKIFIENEINLHTFEIEITDCEYNYFDNILELILQNVNFISNIKNLYLYVGSPMGFSYHNDNNQLIKNHISQIINSHQNLKKIAFCYDYYSLYQSFLLSKEFNCSNTLKSIIFYYVDFHGLTNLSETFEQLNVLESVHIIECLSLNNSFVQKVINLSKPFKLKTLFISDISQIDSLDLLLQKSGDYLKNFGFTPEYNSSLSLQLKLLELIIKYCKNINYLYLSGIVNQIVYLIFDLIENIKHNLNYLTISSWKNDTEPDCYSTILRNLGQKLPSKLEYLELNLPVKKNDFEVFLNNSQDIFIKKFLIYNQEGEDILPSMKECIMKKKRFEYLSIYDSVIRVGRDLSLLDNEVREFSLYNIKVQSYRNLVIGTYHFIRDND
ncbi:hypothetical protein RclHR1_20660003 [Rhizophagus clarus]|uniref:Uncharacterized protein n=1 Tax=Rhizophagus clarus TaxID=94130 RepID=A0A2Z6QS32_9GLOM|nr:hypothetical protein RclHR1_20660003 [Rhizophagus clarus]GES94940.1 hypothetical protein GLOIN_2v1881853 [Rhizophagus clarus]